MKRKIFRKNLHALLALYDPALLELYKLLKAGKTRVKSLENAQAKLEDLGVLLSFIDWLPTGFYKPQELELDLQENAIRLQQVFSDIHITLYLSTKMNEGTFTVTVHLTQETQHLNLAASLTFKDYKEAVTYVRIKLL